MLPDMVYDRCIEIKAKKLCFSQTLKIINTSQIAIHLVHNLPCLPMCLVKGGCPVSNYLKHHFIQTFLEIIKS